MNTLPLKTLGKRLLSLLYSHTQGDLPDIFIVSTQRSGSTLLFDMVADQPGFKAVGEPLQERKERTVLQYLPRRYSRYTGFAGEEGQAMERGMEAYLRDLLAGRFVGGFERTYDLRNPRHHFRSERNAVKILRATHLLPWLTGRFPGEFLLLVRHPVPTALSRTRNGWDAPLASFTAQHRWFASLTTEQQRMVLAAGGEPLFRRHLLTWCLEHTGVLPQRRGGAEYSHGQAGAGGEEAAQHAEENQPGGRHEGTGEVPPPLVPMQCGALCLHYEELVARADEVLPYLAGRWRLPEPERFAARFAVPSRSAKYSAAETKSAIGRGDAAELLGRWRQEVDSDDLEYAARALEVFGISAYRAEEVMPA